jgi:hypothetical protein
MRGDRWILVNMGDVGHSALLGRPRPSEDPVIVYPPFVA